MPKPHEALSPTDNLEYDLRLMERGEIDSEDVVEHAGVGWLDRHVARALDSGEPDEVLSAMCAVVTFNAWDSVDEEDFVKAFRYVAQRAGRRRAPVLQDILNKLCDNYGIENEAPLQRLVDEASKGPHKPVPPPGGGYLARLGSTLPRRRR